MAVKVTLTLDLRPLERLKVNAKRLDGEAVLYGIPSPAAVHRGQGGKPSGVTTAFTLARVEFGPPRRASAPTPSRSSPRRRRRRSFVRRLLRKFLGGFGRPRAAPRPALPKRPPTSPGGERPVLRWVSATQRPMMVDSFRAAAKQALSGKDPRADLELLGQRLAEKARARLTEVTSGGGSDGEPDTGQTRDSITHKIVRRFGPGGGGPVKRRR